MRPDEVPKLLEKLPDLPEPSRNRSHRNESEGLTLGNVQKSYEGQSDGVLSHSMAVQMLTPQIDDRGLGPVVLNDGGDLFYFMHPGANDGYASVLVAYPQRGQGVVILTNGDNGTALWREILNCVSIEYGWVKDDTLLHVIAAAAILLALAGIVIWVL
jgi:hypothetical protein